MRVDPLGGQPVSMSRVSPRGRVFGAVLLFVVLVVCACRVLIKTAWSGARLEDEGRLLYPAATLGIDYPEFGFMRRGLGGTLIHWSGLPQLSGTELFHVVSAALVAAVACRLVLSMRASVKERAVHVLVLIVVLLFWAEDPGRTDVAIAWLLGVIALAARAGRPVRAVLLLLVALAIHETGVIYGVPLAAVILMNAHRERGVARRGVSIAAGLLACTLVGYLFFDRFPHVDNAIVAATVRSRLPRSEVVDWALYFGLSGVRGVRTSICQNWVVDQNYALHVLSGLLVIGFATFILVGTDRRLWRDATLASLPPYLFLCLVANDMSRWTMLAVASVWIVSACRVRTTEDAGPRRFPASVLAVVVLLVFTHPRRPLLVSHAVYMPSPLIEALSVKLGRPSTPGVDEALRRCDPNWLEVLDARGR
jgi:hypothetical protein